MTLVQVTREKRHYEVLGEDFMRGAAGCSWFISRTFTDKSPSLFQLFDLEPVLIHVYPYVVGLHQEVQLHISCNLGLLLWKRSHDETSWIRRHQMVVRSLNWL